LLPGSQLSLKAASVPALRATANCLGDKIFFHSASLFTTLSTSSDTPLRASKILTFPPPVPAMKRTPQTTFAPGL
jgi:hypothetical protein